jgi:hypothetical protein
MKPMHPSGSAAANQTVRDDRTIDAQDEVARSSYGTIPGNELPAAVYISVFVAFMWVLIASWIAFAREADANLLLGVAVVLAIVFFALPVLVHRVAKSRCEAAPDEHRDFLSCRVETATGPLAGSSAWLQVVLIPASLALAATLIGVTALVVH